MSAPQSAETEAPVVTVARLALAAVRHAEAAREAFNYAMGRANQLGVVLPGWVEIQQADAALAQVVNPRGRLRVLAEAELRAAGETP